jgi:hypothetical protein
MSVFVPRMSRRAHPRSLRAPARLLQDPALPRVPRGLLVRSGRSCRKATVDRREGRSAAGQLRPCGQGLALTGGQGHGAGAEAMRARTRPPRPGPRVPPCSAALLPGRRLDYDRGTGRPLHNAEVPACSLGIRCSPTGETATS